MKTHHPPPKLKPIFSCGFFRNCTQSAHSPTSPLSPPLPTITTTTTTTPPQPPSHSPPPHLNHTIPAPDSSTSESSSSHSFTQWRFPPTFHRRPQPPPPPPPSTDSRLPHSPSPSLEELFHVAELRFSTGSDADRSAALQMLERALVPNPPSDSGSQPRDAMVSELVMDGVVEQISRSGNAGSTAAAEKSATKVLLALCLAERNRHVAVERGAVGRVVEALADLDGVSAERALATLELMCTVSEGAAEIRGHALAVPMLVGMMGKMEGRGREYAISVLAVIYGGQGDQVGAAPPEEVARAVELAMQGDCCTARGRRKGAQLLKTLQENGRLDLTRDGR